MTTYTCVRCGKSFNQKGHFSTHNNRKRPCTQVFSLETLIEQKIMGVLAVKGDGVKAVAAKCSTTMNYASQSRTELLYLCKERGFKRYSNKKKAELIVLLSSVDSTPGVTDEVSTVDGAEGPIVPVSVIPETELQQEIIHGDTLSYLPSLKTESAQIIIADPPYNIGKDFGNDSDKQSMPDYLAWCDIWIADCLRILKPNGTMFIYGFSEILALILARIPLTINRRWIIWHYTNKNVASLQFWQRSHESILILWKEDKVFHRDEVREAYTEGFLHGAAGRERTSTVGRFSNGTKKTTYIAHPGGALPRDVIKIPALAGGAGMIERVNHPTQKPLILCDKLLKSCMQPASEGYVLIPFAGSGSECLAAKNLNLPFIGIEINAEYVTLIKNRLTPPPPQLQPSPPQTSEETIHP